MTKWLDEEEQRAWRALLQVHSDVHAALDAELIEQHSLTEGEYELLVRLSEADGHQLRMCDLANATHLSPSGLTRRLDRLVREALVTRGQAIDDRRVSMAQLTAKGLKKLKTTAPDHVDGVRRHLMDHLSRTQVQQLTAALEGVIARRHANGL